MKDELPPDRLGRDFPVTIKISGDEYIEGGLHIKEMSQIAHLAQEAGIDGILVSAGTVGGKKVEAIQEGFQAGRSVCSGPASLFPSAEGGNQFKMGTGGNKTWSQKVA